MHRWCLLNLTVQGFSLNLTVRGVSNKHCLLTFFIRSSLICVCTVCLGNLFVRQLVFKILEHLPYHNKLFTGQEK